ncbi:3'(2'),5'-bisphosphate nucleotidase CysQ [Kribbella qitaiheensis]|uniref:3'(2'),5'-bisphosphate nucleotidase CysQ n=1 Tax=Kribbella qitaiheensis TaxID=1544730 RepID=A0A7G6WSE5_9ACTN|nr:inositol monophosphatase family protein [Kribbella qitaiheensis]QNE16910.1 3'(2'),5'-bisphosphate nucleotidase CysQ [Kribbella qitaiheensis]
MTAETTPIPGLTEDGQLLTATIDAVRTAGERVREQFTADARPADLPAIWAALAANDAISNAYLRDALLAARPGAGWVEEELDSSLLPDGEWWVTDPVEGNVNAVHGLPDWAVTATLIRDNRPVLAAVHLPMTGDTYTAVAGGGAFQNGTPLNVSAKSDLRSAYVGTGQAQPGENAETVRRMGESTSAMLTDGFVLRTSVPATLQLTQVAAGRMDVFWQFSEVRSGLVSGALLVAEAGGTITDIQGRPWTLASDDFLAAAPGVHLQAVTTLSAIR